MSLQDLTTLPTPPSRDDPPEVFIERADAWVAAMVTLTTQINTLATQLEATAALIAVAPAYADPGLVALTGLTPAADRLPYFDAVDGSALANFTGAGRALVDDADAAAQRTTLELGSIATFAEATAAQFRNNTADKALSTDGVWSAAASVTLTPGTNVAVDLNSGLNFTLAMGGNYTLDNATNGKDGQSGKIEITQDGGGSKTLAFGTNWIFPGGVEAVLSTAGGARDVLFFQVMADGKVFASLAQAVA